MEDKNIGKSPSLPDGARREALPDEALETAAGGGTFGARTPEQKALEARAKRLAAMTGEHPTQVLMRLLKESKGG